MNWVHDGTTNIVMHQLERLHCCMCFLEFFYNELAFQVDRSPKWSWHEEDKIVLKLDLIMLAHEVIENLYV